MDASAHGLYCRVVNVCVVCVLFSIPLVVTAQQPVTRIAAASSMRFVLDDLIKEYADTSGDNSLQAVYGSSGNLYRQILQGAPYDMFLSADHLYITELASNKKLVQTSLFAIGTLVLYSPTDQPRGLLLDSMINAFRDGDVAAKGLKIAVANPGHAPFGRAAKEVLQSFDLWQESQPHLVMADNVSQAAQFARTGAVAFAFVAQSLVHNFSGLHEVVPQRYYSPLQLTMALLSESPSARAFQVFTQSPQARDSFDRYNLRMTPGSGGTSATEQGGSLSDNEGRSEDGKF